MSEIVCFSVSRLYSYEVDKSCEMNENLGSGIAVFQGLSNIALNCECITTKKRSEHNTEQTGAPYHNISCSDAFVLLIQALC